MSTIQRSLSELGKMIIHQFGKELIEQKHKATGRLIAGFNFKVQSYSGGLELLITNSAGYAGLVNRGRKPGHRVPIQDLIDWIEVKGLETGDKAVRNLAYAIQTAIWREGIPTRGSRRLARKRTEFIEDSLIKLSKEIDDMIQNAAFMDAEVQVINLQKKFNDGNNNRD